ncbi:hypothetical protein ACQPUY_04550 [Clostridium nigeriense]|uniref:hypothetical protein n=1 Tax=Clostridium nigeriense TaxID=1805470 RepID=UPI003D34CEB7
MDFILEQISNFYKNGDILSLSWALIIISFTITFKFIFSNNIKSNDKNSELNDCALKSHIDVQNDIFLYKNQKLNSIYLITSLNKLQYYNNSDYSNLLKNVTTYNIKNKISEIENFVNENIAHLKKEQNYVINKNKINYLEKITTFFKDTNITLFLYSIIQSYLILFLSCLFLNIILKTYQFDNFIIRFTFVFSIIFILVDFLLIFLNLYDYMNKKNYYFVSLIIIVNLTLIFIIIFALKFEIISKYLILKSVLLLISLVISFIFSIKIDYITSKLKNIKSNIKNDFKKLKSIK